MINKKIAIPLEGKTLCAHFGHCEEFAMIEVKEGVIVEEKYVVPPPHEPGLLPGWLAEQGVHLVIAGGMGQRALNLFAGQGIPVHVGAQAKAPKELVDDWLQDALLTGSNACDH